MNDLDQIIERLKEELGPVADFLTDAVIRQLWYSAAWNVVWIVIATTAVVLVFKRLAPYMQRRADEDTYSEDLWSIWRMIAMWAVPVVAFFILMTNLWYLGVTVFNPQWAALDLLRELAS